MYSKVEIFGGCDVNYLHVKNHTETTAQISDVVSQGLSAPEWKDDTLMLANYNYSIDGTPLNLVDGSVIGYQVHRYDVNKNIMTFVAQTSYTKIKDYLINDRVPYRYYIFPIIETDSGKVLGAPIVTDTIVPSLDMCTIIGLVETKNKNEYTVDPNNIWRLQLNVEREDYTLNMDKTFTDGFDRFAKRTQGIKKYVTSGVNSIVGTIECSGDKVNIGSSDIERWEDFCYSSNLKLYNDMRGRILPIDIETVSTGYLSNALNSPVVTRITFRQLADASKMSVYGLDGV